MPVLFTQREILISVISGGIASGVIFSLALGIDPTGILFVSLPPMLIGLAIGARHAAFTACIACLTCAVLTGSYTGPAFLAALIGVPTCYFVKKTLLWRQNGAEREWYPMLRLLSEFSIVTAALFMLFSFAMRDKGGMQALVPHDLPANFKNTDPDIAATLQRLTSDFGFVLLALLGWIWVMSFYGFAALANFILKFREYALRPSLAIESRGIPSALLCLLIISGLLAVFGQDGDRFIAEIVFLIMLLPYFLSGLACVHEFSIRRGIAFRKGWLACFYIVLICVLWPVLAVIAAGLYLQLAEILDRGKKIG